MLYENENKLTRATHVSMNEPRRYNVGRESQTQNNIHHEFPFINLETYPTNTFEQCLLGWWRQKEEPGSDHKEGGGSGGEGHVAAPQALLPAHSWCGRAALGSTHGIPRSCAFVLLSVFVDFLVLLAAPGFPPLSFLSPALLG